MTEVLKVLDVGSGLKVTVYAGGGGYVEGGPEWDDPEAVPETIKDLEQEASWLAGKDMLFNLVLAHAVAGVDVESKAYKQGVAVALDSLVNEYGD
ncbi:MAG: hypothetical protein ACREGR_01615 [Minisyncoccia bacterium]